MPRGIQAALAIGLDSATTRTAAMLALPALQWSPCQYCGDLYQRPQAVTGLAHSRRVMEAMRSGMAMSVFQAWQQVSTIAW